MVFTVFEMESKSEAVLLLMSIALKADMAWVEQEKVRCG